MDDSYNHACHCTSSCRRDYSSWSCIQCNYAIQDQTLLQPAEAMAVEPAHGIVKPLMIDSSCFGCEPSEIWIHHKFIKAPFKFFPSYVNKVATFKTHWPFDTSSFPWTVLMQRCKRTFYEWAYWRMSGFLFRVSHQIFPHLASSEEVSGQPAYCDNEYAWTTYDI